MKGKQPLYSALGWATWTIGKRMIKRKLARGGRPRRGRKLLLVTVMLGGLGAAAYAATASNEHA